MISQFFMSSPAGARALRTPHGNGITTSRHAGYLSCRRAHSIAPRLTHARIMLTGPLRLRRQRVFQVEDSDFERPTDLAMILDESLHGKGAFITSEPCVLGGINRSLQHSPKRLWCKPGRPTRNRSCFGHLNEPKEPPSRSRAKRHLRGACW
jgi:hypothetical protein